MKLDKKILDRRIELMKAEGVEFKTGVDVGKDITAEELKRQFDRVILAEDCDSFFLTVVGFQYLRPLRPRVGWQSLHGRFWHHLQLCDGFCSLADSGTHTVVTSITTTDD